jgi:hypothetical protein
VHALADVHDTPLSAAAFAPGGPVTDWIAHVEPFHRSTNGEDPAKPTATQAFDDGHDTPTSSLSA